MRDEIALVTGASKGIGRSISKQIAQIDLAVLATARNESELQSLRKEITDIGGQCDYYSADLREEHEVNELVRHIESSDLKIKILVHCAGIARVGTVAEMPFSEWQETIEVNLTVPFILTQKCIPLLSDNSHIFFINSVAGRQSFPEWSAYCASKKGLHALADSLRQELASRKIKVTSVFPSSVDTPMQDQLPYEWDRRKMLKPNDVAKAVISCYQNQDHIQIKEIDLENLSGTF